MSNTIYPFKTKRAYNFARMVTQVAHGFAVGEQVYRDAAGAWALAQADDIATMRNGMVEQAIDADTFVVVYMGLLTWPTHGFTPNTSYFLDQATPGAVVTPQPAAGFAQFCFTAMDADTVLISDQAILDNS